MIKNLLYLFRIVKDVLFIATGCISIYFALYIIDAQEKLSEQIAEKPEEVYTLTCEDIKTYGKIVSPQREKIEKEYNEEL